MFLLVCWFVLLAVPAPLLLRTGRRLVIEFEGTEYVQEYVPTARHTIVKYGITTLEKVPNFQRLPGRGRYPLLRRGYSEED